MSAAAASRAVKLRSPRGFKVALPIRKPLKRGPNGLPIPHVKVIVRDTQPCRVEDHYYHTVRDDLMYMSYIHETGTRKPPRQVRLAFDPEDPYTKHRHNAPVGAPQWTRSLPPPSSPDNVIQLEKIQLHTMVKEAISSRSNLLGAIMAFRAISGESQHSGGRRTTEGVQIVRGRKAVGGWVRPGIPLGVKVDLKGPNMYDFIGTLVEFVLPRLREFPGLVMPAPSANPNTPSAASGVVSFGLPPEAMALFPQIEVNLDAYPKTYGMHIHFVTSAEGVGAQNRARTLLSGFQIPFSRK
ncbi:hypothetical protein NLI96_g3856 [Meripilus lineatus]|uniref:Large ribosomal subunit protein uL5 C-terminal domain-containing protein n=1 Tax=Meripilus lineatus TaxID=2056292 RepID=A0AAD5V608_9APHY|nr:hypothetical protein NLI96_g3856 [Physisporinus lineatus]